jgi:hypothetical protein
MLLACGSSDGPMLLADIEAASSQTQLRRSSLRWAARPYCMITMQRDKLERRVGTGQQRGLFTVVDEGCGESVARSSTTLWTRMASRPRSSLRCNVMVGAAMIGAARGLLLSWSARYVSEG